MTTSLLHSDIQDFINASLEENVTQLALKKNPFPETDWSELLNQIAAKQKAKTKLPTWFNSKNILYPAKISVEQTSSEATAAYKATLISGNTLMDLTGGFGVDDYYFAQKVQSVIHCEINEALSDIVQHNLAQLGVTNIQCVAGDSADTLKQFQQTLDWIYIDPSRRSDTKGKVFMLKDCLPNVPELLDTYFTYATNILIKTAPILDLTAGIAELQSIAEIHIVALDNEVKELLWVLRKGYQGAIAITASNLLKEGAETFSFVWNQPYPLPAYSLPQKYLYEPNAAIMKSGGFDVIPTRFGVEKLHQHSQLYTSDTLVDFPGRVFEIEQTLKYNKADCKAYLEGKKANITTRNFPDTVATIRKKWKITDGGALYCFFTTNATNEKIVLLCSKIQ